VEKNSPLKGLCSTQMMSFPEVISPGDLRNDIYVTMTGLSNMKAKFSSVELKNILCQVRVFVKGEQGPVKCIVPFSCSDMDSEEQVTDVYQTSVYYHWKSPKWHETIRITIDPSKLDNAFIVFLLLNCPSRHANAPVPFGVSYVKLTDNRGLIPLEEAFRDKPPSIYKHQKNLEMEIDKFHASPEVRSKLATSANFLTSLKVVSTKITQNENLKNLLNWQVVKGKPMEDILSHFLFIKMDEKVTFLREIFEALFSILSEHENNSNIAEYIFKALVNIIGSLVSQRQFENYREIMDEYISNYFTSTSAYRWILHFVTTYLSKVDAVKDLSETMKALNYLFQFIVKSWLQFEKKQLQKVEGLRSNPEQEEAEKTKFEAQKKSFQDNVLDVMQKINKMLSLENPPAIIGAQGNLLKFCDSFFNNLAAIFDAPKLGEIINEFLDSIPPPSEKKKNLIQGKLSTIGNIVRGEAFNRDGTRSLILPKIIEQLLFHFARNDAERTACVEILMNMMRSVQNIALHRKGGMSEAVLESLYTIFSLTPQLSMSMDFLVKDYEQLEREATEAKNKQKAEADEKQESSMSPVTPTGHKASTINTSDKADIKAIRRKQADVVCAALAILYMYDFQTLEYHLKKDEEIASGLSSKTLKEFFNLQRLVLTHQDSIPSHWNAFLMFTYTTLLKSIDCVGQYMLKSFLSDSTFNFDLWDDLIKNTFKMLLSPQINLETFSNFRRLKFLNRVGDIRLLTLKSFNKIWDTMNSMQMHFVPGLINFIMRIFDFRTAELRKAGLNLYYSVLSREYSNNQTLEACEGVTQRCVVESTVDDSFRKDFIDALESKFKDDPVMGSAGTAFLKRLKDLLVLVVEIQKYKDTDEDEKTAACDKVMNYFKEHDNLELYYTYAHTLSKMHINLQNYVEAALALNLHASRLSFESTVKLRYFSDEFPEELECERKVKLYQKMIDLYDKGKDWERAIDVSKELHQYYEKNYEYLKMESLLTNEGKFYSNVIDKKRFFAEYFLVTFYGKGLQKLGLAGKYIYRGKELERHTDFINKMKQRFVGAEYLSKPPKEDLTNKDGMYFEAFTITASNPSEFNNDIPVYNHKRSPKISKYLQLNNVRMFTSSRLYRTNNDKTDNEYKDMHREMTFYLVQHPFPHYARRQKVMEQKIVLLDPINRAIRDVEDKIGELIDSVNNHQLDPKPDTNSLSMLLNGYVNINLSHTFQVQLMLL
jgi:hypothetical protein